METFIDLPVYPESCDFSQTQILLVERDFESRK
jgi:hypothetical protein